MATAFTYSGTGLESAIQSGSGGIGTGSSITLEVDAVPSDVSQGDTVKVALGGASDWSGGTGETAYGDIGGAGANGGTNITLTDRGQEGTSASSWSEGASVRIGVQGREDRPTPTPRVFREDYWFLTAPGGGTNSLDDEPTVHMNAINIPTIKSGRLMIAVKSAGAGSGTTEIVIYDWDINLIQSTEVDATTTGDKTVDIAQPLSAGPYFFGLFVGDQYDTQPQFECSQNGGNLWAPETNTVQYGRKGGCYRRINLGGNTTAPSSFGSLDTGRRVPIINIKITG
jgi:hypothetical protein